MRATGAEFLPAPFATWAPYGELSTRLDQTGHGPFRWPTPDGYPDTAQKWETVSPMAQTWRLLSRMPELRAPGSGNTPFLMRIHEITLQAFPNAANRSANAIADFWIDRIVGFPLQPARRNVIVDFLRQNGAADEAINLTEDSNDQGVPQQSGVWNANNLKRHYSIARLRAAVSMILTLPEFYQR
jgi:hypothetical protein